MVSSETAPAQSSFISAHMETMLHGTALCEPACSKSPKLPKSDSITPVWWEAASCVVAQGEWLLS